MASSNSNQRIRWEDLHMGIALLAAERCHDRDKKQGACIVKPEEGGMMSKNAGKVVSVGYRGRVVGPQANLPPDCHAEMNAIAFASSDVKGCTMYVTKLPSLYCAGKIGETGIKEVIYLGKDKPQQHEKIIETLKKFNVIPREFEVQQSSITINFK